MYSAAAVSVTDRSAVTGSTHSSPIGLERGRRGSRLRQLQAQLVRARRYAATTSG